MSTTPQQSRSLSVRARQALQHLSRGSPRDMGWALFGLLGPTLAQLAYVVIAAHALSVDDFGKLMLCVAVSTIAMTLSGAGSGGVAMKAIARQPSEAARFFGQTIVFTGLTAIVLVPGSIVALEAVSHTHVTLVLPICVALADVVLLRVATTCQQVFIGLGQQSRGALVGMMTPIARFVVATLILIHPTGSPLTAFALAYLCSTLVATGFALVYTTRRIGRPILARGKMRYNEGVSFALLWLNATLQVECDKLILSYFASLADVATYSLASRLMDGAFSPPRALKNVLQARMFREGAAGHSAIFRFSLRIVPVIVVYGILAWIAIVVAAPWAVYLFGERYGQLAEILPAIGALPLLRSIADIGGEVFIASDHVGLSTAVQVLATVIRIALGVVLVRASGLHGAVSAALLATAIAGIVFWSASWAFSRRRITA